MLELGGGYGNNGNEFYNLGCKVTSSDARRQHILNGKIKYPYINFEIMDYDKNKINKKYDIILHWGLLYHLKEIECHLENVCKNCDVILLETTVSDSDNENFYKLTYEEGYDQAYNNIGIRPSPKYIEKILSKNSFKYIMIKDPITNSSFHKYDWESKNTNTWTQGARRFWVCWNKNVDTKQLFLPRAREEFGWDRLRRSAPFRSNKLKLSPRASPPQLDWWPGSNNYKFRFSTF